MRKTLLAVALSVTALSAHADYQCSVTPRDDVILSPQQVQVKGENGDLVIKPDGNLTFNGKAYALSAPSANRRRIIRPACAAACRGLTKARVRESKKAARRWIKSLPNRLAPTAACTVA